MLESLLFMFLIFVGSAFVFISFFTVIFGFFAKHKNALKIGKYLFLIPIFCFGLIYFWYNIAVPSFNKSQQKEFSGTYKLDNSLSDIKLYLNADGTYYYDSIPNMRIPKKGLWKTGGIDGYFEFMNLKGNLESHVWPGEFKNEKYLTIDLEEGKLRFYKFD